MLTGAFPKCWVEGQLQHLNLGPLFQEMHPPWAMPYNYIDDNRTFVPPIVVGRTAPTRFCCILGMGSPVSCLLMLKADTFFGRSRISLLWGHVLKFYLAELIS
jgi:hypothetical protein